MKHWKFKKEFHMKIIKILKNKNVIYIQCYGNIYVIIFIEIFNFWYGNVVKIICLKKKKLEKYKIMNIYNVMDIKKLEK